MRKFKYWTITCFLLLGACRSNHGDTASAPTASDVSGGCSGTPDQLSVDCLEEIFKHLPDRDIVRYVNAIVANNRVARNALLSIAQNTVPDWRKEQIKVGLRSEACHYGPMKASDDVIALSFQKELLRNYIASRKMLNDAESQSLVLANIPRLPGSGLAVPIGSRSIVYQDATKALVLLNTTTGEPIFRYEIGDSIVRNFARLNEGQFLSFHNDGKIYLWKSKPAAGDKEPIKVFSHGLEDVASFDSRARLLVIDENTFVSVYIKYAHAFRTLDNKIVSAKVGIGEHVTTIAPGRVLIPTCTLESTPTRCTLVDRVWDVKTGVLSGGSPTIFKGNDGYLDVGHGQNLVRNSAETFIQDYVAGKRIATLPRSFGASMISSEKLLLYWGDRNLSIYDTRSWKETLNLSTAARAIGQISMMQGNYFAIALARGIEIRSWMEPEKITRSVTLTDLLGGRDITSLATTAGGDMIIQNEDTDTIAILSLWGQIAKTLKPKIF